MPAEDEDEARTRRTQASHGWWTDHVDRGESEASVQDEAARLRELIAEDAAAIEAAELKDDGAPLPPWVLVTRGPGGTQTLRVRFKDDEAERLTRLAEEAGAPAWAYARLLILEMMDRLSYEAEAADE